jgi:Cu+-exporting ATPase
MQFELEVSGMTCNHCRASVAQALAKVPGVTHVTVDLAGGRASVSAEAETEVSALTAAVESQGYGARPAER